MRTKQEWTDIIYNKGRYVPRFYDDVKTFKPYKEDKSKLVWNVFNEENVQIICVNIFEYN